MGLLIYLLIIIYIVWRCVKRSKNNAQEAKPNVPRQPQPMPPRQMQPQRPQQQRPPQARVPQQRQAQTRASQQDRQRMPKENAILQRAKQNVKDQFDDAAPQTRAEAAKELGRVPLADEIMQDKAQARHIHSEHRADHANELSNRHGVDDFDTYHVIDEVNDLIVKGYSGNLEFERDFLAEATDMLNRMYQ